ncbi:acyl carrier protein [Bergeyella cardium]|uniref:Acyl carrier protein n=1 Tax=Bergeyella cardium TaxID=1585976 RepID=A0A6P1QVR2_9FLAO|nr:acyl carrier protein [Bergeyella cardium]QHN65855.1 acyl carrier protein [Bergeyella cardium]WHE33457.1 acyl carrier protein [Bergeyella cardium]WHF60107.1 acyl carrier protein [Bergeyella cardium]
MDKNKFIEDFTSIFDEVEVSEVTMATEFKNFEEWSSLAALGLLAVIEEEYDVALTHNDIKNAVTVEDIYNIVQNQK